MNNKKKVFLIILLAISIIFFSSVAVYESDRLIRQNDAEKTESTLLNQELISSKNLLNNKIVGEKFVEFSSSSHNSKHNRETDLISSETPEILGLSVINYPENNSSQNYNVAELNDANENLTANLSKNNSNLTNNSSLVIPPPLKDNYDGQCKENSRETNEGPGSPDCNRADYEECFDYFTQSTAIAWGCSIIPLECAERARGTDYCSSDILNEAYLECGVIPAVYDFVDYQQKNCNDYDGVGDWVYYCTGNEVRKHRGSHNYGCSDGACKFLSGGWVDDGLVLKKGDTGYCSKRREGVDNGWSGCNLCASGDYDCDYDSDCGGALVCKGSATPTFCWGAQCGCCSPSKRWDSTLKTCCECSSVDDPCCDGCHYKSSSTVCNSHEGGYYYSCKDGNCLGNDIFKRDQKRYCSGSSSSCSGNIVWNDPVVQGYCSSSQYCSGSTSWVTTIPTCKSAQCTSGDCCDTTCGKYTLQPTSHACITGLTWYGCPNGNNLGSDVKSKVGNRYCDGYTDACNGNFVWGSWALKQDCSSVEYCGGVEGPTEFWCSSIVCSLDSDCTTGYWSDLVCSNNDVWGNHIYRTCESPGTKQSYCQLHEVHEKRFECGNSEYTGNNYCYSNDVYKDYITRGCLDSSCTSSTSKIMQQDCGTLGCSNGRCNGETCTNECSVGEKKCSGDYAQTCGNYDTDSCLEWPSSTTSSGNEYCEFGCSNGECEEPFVDLTAIDLVIQKIRGKVVTLAFTIKNIGNMVADSVYWKVNTDSIKEDLIRTNPIRLEPNKWTRVYMQINYTDTSSGTYHPQVIVDFDNLITESNESNNEASISVTV